MTITKPEAERLLQPYREALAEAIAGGFAEYLQYAAAHRAKHTRRTMANIIHDHIVARVESHFDPIPNTRCYRRLGGFFLSIEGTMVIRFKKLDQSLRTKNVVTQQVLNFLYQAPDVLDLSIPKPTNLHAGYQLNDLDNAISAIYVTCPAGHENEWEIDLPIPAPAVTPMPLAASSDETPNIPDVRPRPAAEEEDKDAGAPER